MNVYTILDTCSYVVLLQNLAKIGNKTMRNQSIPKHIQLSTCGVTLYWTCRDALFKKDHKMTSVSSNPNRTE